MPDTREIDLQEIVGQRFVGHDLRFTRVFPRGYLVEEKFLTHFFNFKATRSFAEAFLTLKLPIGEIKA